jgi:imidazoleglycerol-phosphate dehydratase
MRTSTVNRETKETKINISVNLDGNGKYQINTGLGFFNHMLEQLSCHSGIDMHIEISGDLHIDSHHTIEDCGLALGLAIKQALGGKIGIARFGSAYVPLDEALSRCVVDLSGRPYVVFDSNFTVAKIGDTDTEMFREFFIALANTIGCNLHIHNLSGINNHHIAESIFKAVAKALKQAIFQQNNTINSTKGVL